MQLNVGKHYEDRDSESLHKEIIPGKIAMGQGQFPDMVVTIVLA